MSSTTVPPTHTSEGPFLLRSLRLAARADRLGVALARAGLVFVLVWIGSLKAAAYEAEGIVPFVANTPLMRFFYRTPHDYPHHMHKEGHVVPADAAWHRQNRTYSFALGLGAVIVAFGVCIALHPWLPTVAAAGSFAVAMMSLTTLSFLITTPECWVASTPDAAHGVPYLAGPGRLVIKDAIMLGAAVVTLADSAKLALRRRGTPA